MMKAFFAAAIFVLGTLGALAAQQQTLWLDELDVGTIKSGFGQAQRNRSISGAPLTMAGKVFSRGIGHHTQGEIAIALPKTSVPMTFRAVVGIDDDVADQGHTRFRVVGDGRELWQSDFVTGADEPLPCEVDVTGVELLLLICDEGPEGYAFDHTDWCDARLEWEGNPELAASIKMIRTIFDDDGKIAGIDSEKSAVYYSLREQIASGPTDEKVVSQAAHPAAAIFSTDRDPLDVLLRRTSALADWIAQNISDDTAQSDAFAADTKKLAELDEQAASIDPNDKKGRHALFDQLFDLRRAIALANPLLDFIQPTHSLERSIPRLPSGNGGLVDRTTEKLKRNRYGDILFIKRHYIPEPEKQGNHMCDQFFGFHARPGGGLFILKNAFAQDAGEQTLVDLLADATIQNGRLAGTKLDSSWGFLSPHLSYDGQQVYFAAADTKNPRHSYTWTEDNCYHIFRVDIDGKNLVQLTDGAWNDFDPYFMPNGRVAFISERRGGYGRCHARPCPSYTLHSMNPDGSDIVALSVHETNEWAPTVDHNGMIVYTRWDYVDRGFNQAHHPWITFPDGRDSRAIQGNYSEVEKSRPHFETTLKPIPDSSRFVATACGHHTQNFGSVILLDPSIEDDDTGGDPMAPIKRVTPDQPFPESEIGVHGPPHVYGQPFPLSEEFFLVAYDRFSGSGKGEANRYGLYLLDIFGNKILLYRDDAISCQWPLAVIERDVPPVIPHQTLVGIPEAQKAGKTIPETLPTTATVGVTKIYTSNRPFPEGTKITELRIVQILPKTTTHANVPWIGYAGENGARKVLGTVPVEEDGSARFEMPVDVPVYFQALDANGVAVQTMRSATYVHPGETLTCLGCHEGRYNTAQNQTDASPMAFQRAPSSIKPDVAGSNPFNYPTLVQPILDRHCVACHEKESLEGKTFKLDQGEENQYFYTSYFNLRPFVYVAGNGNAQPDAPIKSQPDHGGAWNQFTPGRTFPGQFGANRSPLWALIENGHYDVTLAPEEKRALALWMDNNADFFGAYELETLADQRAGKPVAPTLE